MSVIPQCYLLSCYRPIEYSIVSQLDTVVFKSLYSTVINVLRYPSVTLELYAINCCRKNVRKLKEAIGTTKQPATKMTEEVKLI